MKKPAVVLPLIVIGLAFATGVRADTTDSIRFVRLECPGAVEEATPILPTLPTTSPVPLIDNLAVDLLGTQAGLDVEYRLFGPGATHWGSSSFTSAADLGGSKELNTWFNQAAKGKNIRKNITVNLFKSDKTPGRSFILFDCFPVAWTGASASGEATAQTETISVKVGRIEFKT